MTRKRDIQRPFPPEFVSLETLAYLVDFSKSAVDDYVRKGLLPRPIMIGTQPRWSWSDVRAFILSQNGLANDDPAAPVSQEDPFLRGAARVAPTHA